MQTSKAVWLLTLLLVAGCSASQGLDRIAVSEALPADPIPTPENQLLASQSVHLSTPLRLGVFFVNRDFPNRQSIRKVEWLTTDREQLVHQLGTLQSDHILLDAFVLIDPTLRGENTSAVRQAGARHGADLVLIVDGAADVERYNNRYSLLYPTLLGTYLAPGTESNALVMVTGSLWAVRSEWHAPIQTVDGVAKVVGPAVLVEDSTALQKAKEQAIHSLGLCIVDQLRHLAVELRRAKPSTG